MQKLKRFIIVFCSLLLASLSVTNGVTTNASTTAKLASTKINLIVGRTSKIIIKYKNKETHYTYKSSNKKVASVSKTGVVKGISKGKVKITVYGSLRNKKSRVGVVIVTVKAEAKPTVIPTAIPTAVPTAVPTSVPTSVPSPTPGPASTLLSEILKRSLVSTGNNTRIKNAIEKARNGEPVTIAYIGGSITDGARSIPKELCYAYRSYEYFKETFGKGDGNNIKFINAGLSGTSSTIGMFRYNRDVVKAAGGNPDIVFVEFAVNDGGDSTKGEGYESLIRTILKSDNKPAVVLLFSVFQDGYNVQDRMQPIGTYYDLQMVSIRDGILPAIKSGNMKNEEFFHSDKIHPSNEGHKLYADAINYLYDTIDKETMAANDITIPDPKVGNAFEGILMVDSKTTSADYKITPGDFSGVDYNICGYYWDGAHKSFPNNWMHTTTSGQLSMNISITCKSFTVVYKSGDKNTFGKADVYVDEVKKATLNGSLNGNWGNPLYAVIFTDATAKKHKIEIKMADDSTAKNFTIESFGYIK